MKKITLSLLMAISCIRVGYGQAIVSIEAPPQNINYYNILMNGSAAHATFCAVFLYTQTDLAGLTGTSIPSMALELSRGVTGAAVTGNFTVAVENTSDIVYSKGSSYSLAVQTMTTCFNNQISLPASAGSSTINMNFPTPFTYTGGGLYVALRWQSAGPFTGSTSTSFAAYRSATGTAGSPMGAIGDASLSTTFNDAINSTTDRACLLFRATNTATNELGISKFDAPGKVAKLFNSPQNITAEVRNSSTVQKTNIVVTLSITGSNSFSDTKTITAINPGGVGSVTFAPFNPTTSGNNSLTVSLPADINLNNNEASRTQNVNCNTAANSPPSTTLKMNGIGNGANSACMLTKITPATNATLTQVRLGIASDAQNAGGQICGVLLDVSGTIVGMTNTLTISSAMFGTIRTFTFNPTATALGAGLDYYVGMAMVSTAFYPMGCIENPYGYAPPLCYILQGNSGGTPGLVGQNYGYFAIEPVFGFDATTIELTANADIVCKGDEITLTTMGTASGYTWSATAGSGTSGMSTVVATPTAAITNTTTNAVNVTFTVAGKDAASGCVTNVAAKVVTVAACTGIMSGEAAANISMYPNPTVSGKTSVRGLDQASTITVLNLMGQVVSTQVSKDGVVEIELENQPVGTYFVKIADSHNQVKVMKLVNTH